ncbi:MAG: hypothetical protein KGK15_16870 [Burkholderiales bacterium]|uniref:sialidase family protein n=1 Tax=Pandoraea sp. TaxID=1883445 RepID=UPI0011FFEE11|nr:YCF48-related protein [Pandoraea sp.]MDE2289936.1 hypothetical protein [Burkholderiales bacterium]MDE2608599.1 hypothetical protein [Burkholderiales bacterium]TAL80517.1 MAG: hypothetical protein EPN77_19775 [Candidimonas sp.]TAM18960.1 MAG: hypothetical protein EPN65_05170 [Pandoraea sp.]
MRYNDSFHSCALSRRLLRAKQSIIALLAGVVLLLGANIRAATATNSPIVALGFDATNHLLLKADAKALYRSADGGRYWARIALPRGDGRIAAISTSARKAGRLYVGGPGLGILRSDDGGRHWRSLDKGLPTRNVVALAAHADEARTVYAYVAGQGIFRSQDDGLHWRLMDRGPREPILRFVHSNMPGSMQTGWLFAATSNGVARSMDCFCGWRRAGTLTGEVTAIAYDPRQPKDVYAATGKTLLLSTNGGEQWTSLNSPGPAITALLVTPDGTLYAGADGLLFRSDDRAKTWERVHD